MNRAGPACRSHRCCSYQERERGGERERERGRERERERESNGVERERPSLIISLCVTLTPAGRLEVGHVPLDTYRGEFVLQLASQTSLIRDVGE